MEHEGKILLCKRAIEPCRGKWTVPAGFLELNESTAGAPGVDESVTILVKRRSTWKGRTRCDCIRQRPTERAGRLPGAG